MLYYLPWDPNTMICAGGSDKDACQVIIVNKTINSSIFEALVRYLRDGHIYGPNIKSGFK